MRTARLVFVPVLLLVAGSLSAQSVDRAALESLYHATDGPNWRNSDGWLTDAPLDEWYGVTTYEGRVVELALLDNGLRGELPEELGHLIGLRVLDLRWNRLGGTIPISLTYLIELEDLRLTSNEFRGGIPVDISTLRNLTYLDVSYNRLTGQLPATLGQMPNLEVLEVHHNGLTGAIPATFESAPELRRLILVGNDLAGSIPGRLLPPQTLSRTRIEPDASTDLSSSGVAVDPTGLTGTDLLNESLEILPEGPIGQMIESTLRATHVVDGLLWIDPTVLPDSAPIEELARVYQDINERLLRSGERIETLDDFARIMQRYEGEAIELEDAPLPPDSGLSGFGALSAPTDFNFGTVSVAASTSDPRSKRDSFDGGNWLQSHESIYVVCYSDLSQVLVKGGTPAPGVDTRRLHVELNLSCQFQYGTFQRMTFTVYLEIGKRKKFYWYTFYAPIKTERFAKSAWGPAPGYLNFYAYDTYTQTRNCSSGWYRALRKLWVRGTHDGNLNGSPAFHARLPIYHVC